MELAKLKTLVASNLDFAELLYSYLQKYGETLPSVSGKASNVSKRLQQLIGPNKKLDLGKDSEGMRQLLQHEDKRIRKLAEARLATRSWPLHIKKVQNLINYATAREGKIGVPAKYSGAHTHRNSGTEGVNFYNLPARPKKGYELIQEIKTLIHAPAGYKLLTFDYAQIEARYLAYIAGQGDLVQAFREGRDVYSEFATTLFGQKVRKPIQGDPPPVIKKLTVARNFGKMAILGSGYGMGPATFQDRCMEDSSLRSIIIPSLADKIIRTYRKTYSKIPDFWRQLDNTFKLALKYPEDDWKLSCGILVEKNQKQNQIIVILPSGSKLYYQDIQFCKTSNNLKWRYSKGGGFWGGGICENIVQATCRDILVNTILTIKQAGYQIVADLYDSFTVLIKNSQLNVAQKELTDITIIPPKWVKGVPLAVEVSISDTL